MVSSVQHHNHRSLRFLLLCIRLLWSQVFESARIPCGTDLSTKKLTHTKTIAATSLLTPSQPPQMAGAIWSVVETAYRSVAAVTD
jgi:hypothetical protein